MNRLTAERIPASVSAERCSALPWPNWCCTSAGRDATRRAKYVSSAATKSVSECAASEIRPRLCVARPTLSLSSSSAMAAATEINAERRCGLTPGRLELFERPHDDVLQRREEHVRGLAGERKRRHRVQVDHRGPLLEVPARMMDVRAVQPAAVLGVEAVPLSQELLERPGLGVEELPVAAIAGAERRSHPCGFVVHVLAAALAAHARVLVRKAIEPLRRFDEPRGARVEREEPDPGPVAVRH